MLTIGEFARLGQVSPRMLRHDDGLGLLRPAHVDPIAGYRGYEVSQLGRLHRLVALRDLGFGLHAIRPVLDDSPSPEELRAMLRRRQAEIAAHMADEQARLRRVEAHLRALDLKGSTGMSGIAVTIKRTDPSRIAEACGVAPGFGHENLDPVFGRLVPEVLAHLRAVGARPGMLVAQYDEPAEDGSLRAHRL